MASQNPAGPGGQRAQGAASKKMTRVKNKAAASVQITAEQLLREAQERRLEEVAAVGASGRANLASSLVVARHAKELGRSVAEAGPASEPLTQDPCCFLFPAAVAVCFHRHRARRSMTPRRCRRSAWTSERCALASGMLGRRHVAGWCHRGSLTGTSPDPPPAHLPAASPPFPTSWQDFENAIRKNSGLVGNWIKYARWEAEQKEYDRARSVYERALDIDHRNITLWLGYAEMEMLCVLPALRALQAPHADASC